MSDGKQEPRMSVAEQLKAQARKAIAEGTIGGAAPQVPASTPIKNKKGYWVANHPFKFILADGTVIKPDKNGQYHPENAVEKKELDYQVKRGNILFQE